MKSRKFNKPQFFVKKGEELDISSENLPILMRAVLDKNLPFRFSARGNSMKPFIQNGDVITLRSISHVTPSIGDVYAFVDPETEKLVVHRIIAKRNNLLLFIGDNIIGKPDGLIPLNNLIGRVECIHRNGRGVKLGLGPEGIIIALFSFARLGFCYLLRKISIIFACQ